MKKTFVTIGIFGHALLIAQTYGIHFDSLSNWGQVPDKGAKEKQMYIYRFLCYMVRSM